MIAFLDNFSSLPATLQPRIFTTKFPLRKGRRDWKQGIFKYSISGRIGMSWIWSLFFLKFLERSPISKHGFRGSQTFVSGAHPARLRNRVGATKSGRHTFIVYFRSLLATIYNINDWWWRKLETVVREESVFSKAESTVAEWVDFPRRFFPGPCHEKLLNEAARLALPERKVETLQWVKERRRLSLPLRNASTPREHLPCLSFFFFFFSFPSALPRCAGSDLDRSRCLITIISKRF